MKYLQLITIMLLASCSKGTFDNIDYRGKEAKLFFIDITFDTTQKSDIWFLDKHKNFCITETSILNNFKNLIDDKPNNKPKVYSKSNYLLQLLIDDKIELGAYLDCKNECLLIDKKYSFDLTGLDSLSNYFKPLYCLEITELTFNKAKYIINQIQKDTLYVFGVSGFSNSLYTNYSGIIEVSVNKNNFSDRLINHEIERKLKKDFENISKIVMVGMTFSGGDTISFKLYCDKDVSKTLPTQYSIINKYTDILDRPLLIYDIDSSKLNRIVRDKLSDNLKYSIKK